MDQEGKVRYLWQWMMHAWLSWDQLPASKEEAFTALGSKLPVRGYVWGWGVGVALFMHSQYPTAGAPSR